MLESVRAAAVHWFGEMEDLWIQSLRPPPCCSWVGSLLRLRVLPHVLRNVARVFGLALAIPVKKLAPKPQLA
jgi:hypothetical protein